MPPTPIINTAHARRRFDRAAAVFDSADFVHAHTREGLLARLAPVTVDAKRVVDLGCATGAAIMPLEKRFRGARVIGVDASPAMLNVARRRRRFLSRSGYVCCDARALPFADSSVDVVFSNLLLPHLDDPAELAAEVCRVLRKDGLFAFASLGPDSLLELRRAWAAVDDDAHVPGFPDMHDVGDALVRAGLRDPVLDVDRLRVDYASIDALFRDLTASGSRNSLAERRKSLTGRGRIARLRNALAAASGGDSVEVGFELVYGHCWGRGGPPSGDVHIDPGSIPVRRRPR